MDPEDCWTDRRTEKGEEEEEGAVVKERPRKEEKRKSVKGGKSVYTLIWLTRSQAPSFKDEERG